jgi:putative salt-induced outer membrane protein YdiY
VFQRLPSVLISIPLLVLFALASASASELTVKGEPLAGKVVGIAPGGVKFETVYGKGAIEIPWSDVERLSLEQEWVVLHGDTGEARGRVLAIEDGMLMVGTDAGSAARVDPSTIHRAFTSDEYDDSTLDALRARYRYWKGDLGFTAGLTRATNDSTNFAADLKVERRKAPTRFLGTASYRFSETKEPGLSTTRNDNAIRGLLRGEYEFSDRLYSYASATAEYDEVQSLSFRTVPKLGVGYRVIKTEKAELNLDVGPSYVYERFFGGDENDYFAIAFGGNCSYLFPKGIEFSCRGEYLPAVDDWTDNYLLRGSAQLSIPMLDWLSFRFLVEDEYNSTPAPGTVHNRLTMTAGLAANF